MFKTKIDLPEAARVQTLELLNARLADCKDLQSQTKQAHWNVKGPNFIALHKLFDEIAERAVQLGGVAEGTARMEAKRSSLPEYPSNAVDGPSHAGALSSVLATFGKSAQKAIEEATDLRDLDTADLFTEVSRDIDKMVVVRRSELHRRGPNVELKARFCTSTNGTHHRSYGADSI